MTAGLLLTTLFLGILSVCDIRTKSIPAWSAPAFGGAMAVMHLILRDLPPAQFLAGLLPGAALLALSLIFRKGIGTGDGLAVLACGITLGLEREFAALTAAFVFCACFCVILLILKRVKRSDTLAFLPFLAISHLVMLTAEVIL